MPSDDRGALDFETWDWTNPFLAALVGPDFEEAIVDSTFNRPEIFAENVLRRMFVITKAGHVKEWWAHNAGKFDGLILSAAAKRLGWNQTGAIAGGNRVISWRYSPRGTTTSVVLNDSFAVVPSKLAAIAEDFDLKSKKLFEKDDYSQFESRNKAKAYWQRESKRITKGCVTDARLVLEALDKVETLIEDWGGKLKHTFSSSAMSIILSHLEDMGLEWPEIEERVNVYCRSGYYGARVEVFRHMPGIISEYDINSSYPYAMTKDLPWNYAGQVFGKEAQASWEKGYAGIYEADISVPTSIDIPPLPYVGPDGSLYFPTGNWTAFFPGNELLYAASLGCRIVIRSGVIFSKGQPFDNFIRNVYKTKQNSVGAIRNFTKLLLNGSYGKAGEKPEKEQLRVFALEAEALEYAFENEGRVTPLGNDPCICSVDVFRWPRTTHYALASYITAYARIQLHTLLQKSEAPAYCDSDSVHCAFQGIPKEFINNDLGGLKEEIHKGEGRYYAPKIYEIRDFQTGKRHFACKGFPVEEESFKKMILGEKVEKGRMVLAKTQLRNGGNRVARTIDSKRWGGYSMKRCAISPEETRPWSVKEINSKEHMKMISPLFGGKYNK